MKKRIVPPEPNGNIAHDFTRIFQEEGFTVSDTVSSGDDAISVLGLIKPDHLWEPYAAAAAVDGIEAAGFIRVEFMIPSVHVTSLTHECARSGATKSFGLASKPVTDRELATIEEVAPPHNGGPAEHDDQAENHLIPICAWCTKVEDEKGRWVQAETYFSRRYGVEFTHGICPTCCERLLEEDYRRIDGLGTGAQINGPHPARRSRISRTGIV